MRSFIKGLGCGVGFQYYDLGFGDGIGYGNTGGNGYAHGLGYGSEWGRGKGSGRIFTYWEHGSVMELYPYSLIQFWE